jgi:hypothetical protein
MPHKTLHWIIILVLLLTLIPATSAHEPAVALSRAGEPVLQPDLFTLEAPRVELLPAARPALPAALPIQTGAVPPGADDVPSWREWSLADATSTRLEPGSSAGVTVQAQLGASGVQTWTQTTRADWEQGALEGLDSATISGSLQLAQRYFGENTTVTPLSELASGQESPSVAVDDAGNAYVVWADWRDGHSDAYFAYRPAGGSWAANVQVNDDSGTANQKNPDIAVDGNGNAYAVWEDERNGNQDIYFAYHPAGGSWGGSVRVNDDSGDVWQAAPSVAVDGSGNAYVAWTDKRNGNLDIYFAYRPAGESWGANVRVNDDSGMADQSSPAIAVDGSGNTYAVWWDRRNGDYDIYFAHRPAGESWAANERINDDSGVADQGTPAIVVGDSGNAYAVWLDERNSNADIYFAYRPAGGSWGVNERINDDGGTAEQWFPAISVDGSGNAYAVWQDQRNGSYWDIYSTYRPAGGVWETNVQVNDETGPYSSYWPLPAVAVDGSGNAYAVWSDYRNGNRDIYFAHRPVAGSWEANVRVNDDSGAASQWEPSIAVNGSGNAYAVWTDRHNDLSGDIHFAYRPAGGAWGVNIQVNDDSVSTGQTGATIAVAASGNAYAVWEDDRTDYQGDIYFAYRPAGGAWGANVRVNDDGGYVSQSDPSIAVDSNGNAYAVWSDYRNGDYDIYFAHRPAAGSWEANVRVNDDSGTASQSEPRIAVDGSGNSYAVWTDYRDGDNNIYFAYRPTGGSWGVNVQVNDNDGTADQKFPTIAVDGSGNAYAAWYDLRNGDSDIYFAYRPAGGSWGANVKVNDDTDAALQSQPAIAVDGSGNSYAVWWDVRNGNDDIYFAHRQAGGSWGANVRVNDDSGATSQSFPAIAVDGNGIAYVVWRDERSGASNIYFARSLDAPEYQGEGLYTSPELDTGITAAAWESLTWQGSAPAGTALSFETRSHVAGGGWSAWQQTSKVSETFEVLSPPSQYFQYRVTFSTNLTDTTPLLEQVQVTYHSVGTPSAPRFATPCGVTNQGHPTLLGSATGDTVVRVYANGSFAISTTVGSDGAFAVQPSMGALGTLHLGTYVFTATAENESGAGPASTPLTLTVDPALSYDPINVRAGQWSKDGWLMSTPRDAAGCANPDNDWRIWPRQNEKLRVEVSVSYTVSAAVTVTVGTASITLTEESDGLFAGVFQPPITAGDFIIAVNADGDTTIVEGGPVLIDPDGYVYDVGGTINDTIPGVQVTCYYSDTHSGQWVTWDAWTFAQVNPQMTLDDGYYSFYAPPGTYRVMAEKEGYPTYTSPDLVVVSTPVRHNIPLEKLSTSVEVYLPLLLRGE